MIQFPLFIPIFSLQCVHLNLICCYRQPALPLHLSRPRQTEKIPSATLSHGNCGLLTTIAISVLLHNAWPFASWCLFWMIIYTVWRWLHDFGQKQSKGMWKYSGKCLWALEVFSRIWALNLIFSLLACNLLKGSVPARIPEDSDPCLVIWIFLVYVVST